jgi:hypothetical protein
MNIDGTIGNMYQGPIITRPYSFGTDAIERQRVSLGQSLIDADFEYGLQATKWQSYTDVRKTPSFFEIPGTDFVVTNVTSDGASPSTITVTTSSTLPTVGTPVSLSGLNNNASDADRAEGFFLVTGNGTGNFTYLAKGQVTSGSIFTSYTVVKRAGFYNASTNTSGNCFVNVTSLSGNGTTTTATCPENHGLVPGTPITITGFSGGSGSANVNGFVLTAPDLRTFTFSSTLSGTATGGRIYIQPYSYVIHRPFDGGVLISSSIPSFGASIVRQSKKVFRYQSGKGLLWSSGTLFCPNNDLVAVSASGTAVGSTITITTGVGHGVSQTGCTVQIRGVITSGYNGTYIVTGVTSSNTLQVIATQTLGSTTGTLSDRSRFIISRWHGASVRVGVFDDQNGLFWEYDGQTLWVVKRSSTFQLTGLVTCASNGTRLTGTNGTRFTTQLRVNDKFTIRGMTHCVTAIDSDTSLTFVPPYRGTSDITVGAIACKIIEQRVPQSQFNRDTVNGNGPSGYNIDVTKMQMMGLQYTWYGAGFIDFMVRGTDGNWVYAHRFTQNNQNDEAYMRTGNLSVRYELVNETSHATTTLTNALTPSSTTIVTNDQLAYWPDSGTVMIDSEFINYSSKTSNTLVVSQRGASMSYNIVDTLRTFTGSGATSHLTSNTVMLVSTTVCPALTHWGSALLMDGNFDQDRGYLFNYQVNAFGTSLSQGTSTNLFLLRLAPSVSNGVIGDIGNRELMNRAQLLLQRLDVWAQTASVGVGSVIISGILNPSFSSTNIVVNPSSWSAINSAANGSQPSFAQVLVGSPLSTLGSYVAGSGERVFSTICNAGSQYSIDLSGLKEIANGLIGGKNFFPDGPDTLLIQISVPTSSPTPITQYSLNLFWSEAQA